jgi:hypothetical protein
MRIMRLLRNKLRSKCGESLTETLSSLLIIVPAMVMLAGAIVTAANMNLMAKKSAVTKLPAYTYDSSDSGTLKKSSGEVDFTNTTITWGSDNGSIYYYFR